MTIDIRKITSPIICKIGEQTMSFANGSEVDIKGFIVDSVEVEDGKIVLTLAEMPRKEAIEPSKDWIQEHVERFGTEFV